MNDEELIYKLFKPAQYRCATHGTMGPVCFQLSYGETTRKYCIQCVDEVLFDICHEVTQDDNA